jgi:hypothetical protein
MGPMLSKNIGTSVNRFLSIFGGRIEKVPNLAFPTCDVRDVALAHMYFNSILILKDFKYYLKL